MKTIISICLLLVGSSIQSFCNGIKFYHGTWKEVLEEAKKTNKTIFVDFYATWCGPCVSLSKNVFTQDIVGNFFNQNIISFKVDAEKEEPKLVELINLEAYPTLVFFTPEGNIIKKHVGFIEKEDLVKLAREATSFKKLKNSVKTGTASKQDLISYLAMAQTEDPETFQKIAPGLVANFTIEDLLEPDAWLIYKIVVKEIQSKHFDIAINNAETLNSTYDDYYDFVTDRMAAYMAKIVETRNMDGLVLYKNNMERLINQLIEVKRPTQYFDLMANIEFYFQTKDTNNYATNLIRWVDTYFTEDWEELSKNAIDLSSNSSDEIHHEKALSWAKKAVALDRNINSMYSLALVYEEIKQYEDALKIAKELLTFELDEENLDFVNKYIERLKK